MTYNKGGNKTPTKPKSAPVAPETAILVQSVIQGVFSVGAARLGSHWAITDEEAEGIAIPTANIIAKYMDTESMAKYSDPAALMIALGVVVVPRVMITISKKKEVKPNVRIADSEPRPSSQDAAGSREHGNQDTRGNVGYAGDPSKADVNQLLELANTNPYGC